MRRAKTNPTRKDTQETGKRFLFQPLSLIRQTGIERGSSGSATYSYRAYVCRDMLPVSIRLTVTPAGALTAHAYFDRTATSLVKEETGDETRGDE